jgi:hypothetical protein
MAAPSISIASVELNDDASQDIWHFSHFDPDKAAPEAAPTPSTDPSDVVEITGEGRSATEPAVEELFGAPPVIFTKSPLLDADLFATYVNYLYKDSTYMKRAPLRIKAAIRNLERIHRDALRELRNRAKTLESVEGIVEIRRKELILEQWHDKEGKLEGSLVKSAGNAKSISAISEVCLNNGFGGMVRWHILLLVLINFPENSGPQRGI